MPTGVAKCRHAVVGTLEAAKDKLTPLSQERFWQWVEACAAWEAPLASDQAPLDALATTPPACQRLRTIPGMGPGSATALGAAGREARAGKNGRPCAAW